MAAMLTTAYLSCRSLLLLAEVEQVDQQEAVGSLAAKKGNKRSVIVLKTSTATPEDTLL